MTQLFTSANEVNREAVNTAIGQTMNDRNSDLLSISIEMSGKKIVIDSLGKNHIVGSEDDIKSLESPTGVPITYQGATGTTALTEEVKKAFAALLGIDPASITSGTITTNVTGVGGAKVTQIVVQTKDPKTGTLGAIGVQLNSDGAVVGFGENKGTGGTPIFAAITANSFLGSWGIDASDLRPGDLFMVQQNLQIIKDEISALQTAGKSHSDIMREATQKFSQA